MEKGAKKKAKKKDVDKEVLKDDEKWYGLEKKFWTVVEFGVYAILLTFTSMAIGYEYNTVINSNKGSIIIDDDIKGIGVENGSSFMYSISDICTDESSCNSNIAAYYKGDNIDVHYDNANNKVTLIIGTTELKPANNLKEFAKLSNGFIATVEEINDVSSRIVYYDEYGNELKNYVTFLGSTGKLDSMSGIYGTCVPKGTYNSDKTLNIIQYNIDENGSFIENNIATFDKTNCGE